MTEGLINGNASNRWAMVPVGDIVVYERQRAVDPKHVKNVQESFDELGSQMQLQPIVLADKGDHLKLLDGAHRLEAAKQAGWTHIRAEIWSGLDEDDEPLLEAESNRIRKPLTAVEVEEVWTKILEPAYRARGKRNQGAAGSANLPGQADSLVTRNPGNLAPAKRVSLDDMARDVTGFSRDTIAKVADIRQIAESPTASEEMATAARRGLEKIQNGSGVNAVHKAVMKLEFKSTASVAEAEARRREKELDQVVHNTTMLAERLGEALFEDLRAAAGVSEMGREQLRAARVALSHSVSHLVVIECLISEDPVKALRVAGSEVTKMLRDITAKGLDLDLGDDDGR